MYRLTVSEKGRDLYGRALEILGSYNPHNKDLQVKNDRINYWLGNGAGMSPTVNNLLIDKGVIKGEKVKASKGGPAKPEEEKLATPEKTEEKPKEEAKEAETKTE